MREWGMEEGKAGKWRNEGGQAGRGEHVVKEEWMAGRGRAWSEGGSEGGQGGGQGGREGREGEK